MLMDLALGNIGAGVEVDGINMVAIRNGVGN